MLVRIFRKLGLPEYRITELLEKLARIKTVLSAIFYTIMVFVVIIGISGNVYAGFSKPVPYMIIAVFLFMSFVRMYQCLVDSRYTERMVEKYLRAGDKKKSHAPSRSGAVCEKTDTDGSDEEDFSDTETPGTTGDD